MFFIQIQMLAMNHTADGLGDMGCEKLLKKSRGLNQRSLGQIYCIEQ